MRDLCCQFRPAAVKQFALLGLLGQDNISIHISLGCSPEDEVVRETVTLVTACDKQTETNRPFEESSSSGEDSEATPSDSPSQRFSAGIAFHTGVEMVREVVQRRH
ncbi:hypothetical protein EOD39_8591 [Acipenser ruthenus]|uniref:Uncharacterized protein n=1 Tax=Acipenser ruthenus TaxID=7906 RepID=A0A444U3J5_ACIRT|nr:hypothetical protein EOD39_8591 [Acipenser ruthenus]